MMGFMRMFDGELQHMLDPLSYIDCRLSPDKLLREMKSSNAGRKLAKAMESTSTNPFKFIKLLSVCNLLMIYSKDWFQFIEEKLKLKVTKDDWLNRKFIEPYFKFIVKCCASQEQYTDAKNGYGRKDGALQGLFYSINMLKLLFKIVEKMPFLGRYYKSAHSAVVSSAVEILALQAQKLYGYFKSCLNEILYRREFYIKNKNDELILRGVFGEELITINQEMKKLFLDKYFYPLGRGIGVKLFRPEQQSPQFQKTINAIVNNHQETQRIQKQKQLEDTLFPESGIVNWNFYQQTLLGGPISVDAPLNSSTFKGLEELVLSDQQGQEQQPQESEPKPSFLKQKQISGKDTNTGTMQKKGDDI